MSVAEGVSLFLTSISIIYFMEIGGLSAFLLRKYRYVVTRKERPHLLMTAVISFSYSGFQLYMVVNGLVVEVYSMADFGAMLSIIGMARLLEMSIRRRGCFYRDVTRGCHAAQHQ